MTTGRISASLGSLNADFQRFGINNNNNADPRHLYVRGRNTSHKLVPHTGPGPALTHMSSVRTAFSATRKGKSDPW